MRILSSGAKAKTRSWNSVDLLAAGRDWRALQNRCYREEKRGEIRINPLRPLRQDLDGLLSGPGAGEQNITWPATGWWPGNRWPGGTPMN